MSGKSPRIHRTQGDGVTQTYTPTEMRKADTHYMFAQGGPCAQIASKRWLVSRRSTPQIMTRKTQAWNHLCEAENGRRPM